jgi:hypothetical protein
MSNKDRDDFVVGQMLSCDATMVKLLLYRKRELQRQKKSPTGVITMHTHTITWPTSICNCNLSPWEDE